VVFVRLHEITVDSVDVARVGAFWSALLGSELHEPMPGWLRLRPPPEGGPLLNFQPVPEPKRGKARVHLDLVTDDLGAAIDCVIGLGGRYTGERHEYDEGTVVVMTDPEGTEFCLVEYAD
jgi:predicted enzyme related to lactoylglutathione lyase